MQRRDWKFLTVAIRDVTASLKARYWSSGSPMESSPRNTGIRFTAMEREVLIHAIFQMI